MPGPRGERRALLAGGRRGLGRRARAAAGAVLLVQALERAAFFGVAGNLVLYLSASLRWPGEQASRAALVFLGASYLLAPVGGWLADVYLGRFRAVALSLLLYLAACGLLPATALPDGRRSFCGEVPLAPVTPACPTPGCPRPEPAPYCAPTLYVGLLLLALAASSVRSNLTSFGADQVSGWRAPPREARAVGGRGKPGTWAETQGREAWLPGRPRANKPLPQSGPSFLVRKNWAGRKGGCSL